MVSYIFEQKGILLVEVVIAMTLIVILLSGIAFMVPSAAKAWHLGCAKAEIQQTARVALERITQQVRYAKQVSLADNGETLVIENGDGWKIKFTVNQATKALCISVNGAAPDPLAGNGTAGLEGTVIIVENPDNSPRFSVQDIPLQDKDGKLSYIKLVAVTLTVKDKQTAATYTLRTNIAAVNTLWR